MTVRRCTHHAASTGIQCANQVDDATAACAAGHPNPNCFHVTGIRRADDTARRSGQPVADIDDLAAYHPDAPQRREFADGQIVCWTVDGVPHRDDGPAMVSEDGTEVWYRYGKRHRDGGPAVIDPDGVEMWFTDGELHRDGGPAVVRRGGGEEWWVHGVRHRDGGPAVVTTAGTRQWWRHGELHREGGPAVVHADGASAYFRHGVRHRDDGPAVVRGEDVEWWLDGAMVDPFEVRRRRRWPEPLRRLVRR